MRGTLVLIALLLLTMGLALFTSGVNTKENQNETRVIIRNTLDNADFYVDKFGYQVRKTVLNAGITILVSLKVTGMVGGGNKACIDLYVLNNMSYANWLRKEAEHRKDISWFMKEEDLKYISVEVHGTGNYTFNTDHTGTYYFVLDNSGRCSKIISFKLFEVERVETEPSTSGNNQLTERLSLVSGAGLLALGLILLLYGFSSEPPPTWPSKVGVQVYSMIPFSFQWIDETVSKRCMANLLH